MTILRRILTGALLAAAVSGMASADLIESFTTQYPASGSQLTDFGYTLTLPQFNVAGATLNSVTLIFYAAADVTSLSITNSGSAQEDNFEVVFTLNDSLGQVNSLVAADKYGNQTLSIFDSGLISLGNNTNPACPLDTPSPACSSVFYTPPDITDSNVTDAGVPCTVVTGAGGLTGCSKVSASPSSYVGPGTFTLSGNTKAFTSFSGGGGNIALNQTTLANMKLEVDYDYVFPSGTPEPTTMALMGGALLGLGLLGKRFKK